MEGVRIPGGAQCPPGFRFHPTDQELIIHYLSKKVTNTLSPIASIITEVELYKFNPWDLPDKASFGEGEWFFYSPRDRKYPNGARPNRAAGSGYWKATGTDKPILTAGGGTQCLGVKKGLVFYKGRPPKGTKTEWVMQEYRLLDGNPSCPQKPKSTMRLDDWVLCRVRHRSSLPLNLEEKHELRPVVQQAEKQRNGMTQWGDYQLLACLMESADKGESACESTVPGSTKSYEGTSDGVNTIHGGWTGMQTEQVSSVLDSMKRGFPFGALDEMMSQPGKRVNYSRSVRSDSNDMGYWLNSSP